MKKVIALFAIMVMGLSLIGVALSGCASAPPENLELSDIGQYNYTMQNADGHIAFKATGLTDLYYDPATKVVYIIATATGDKKGFGFMSPYYAPNGLPYLWDTTSGKLSEIKS